MDPMARDAKARSLCARISSERRTETELDVLDLLLSGIESHEGEYGGADADTDDRDCEDERDQEMQDGLFYHLLEAVKRRAARRRTLDIGDRLAAVSAALVSDWNESFEEEPTTEYQPAPPTPHTSFDVSDIDDLTCAECSFTTGHDPDCSWVVVVPGKELMPAEEGAA